MAVGAIDDDVAVILRDQIAPRGTAGARRPDGLTARGVEHKVAIRLHDADANSPPVGNGRPKRRIGSICTGTFLLAYAGLLDGRRVTTHWAFASKLARGYPKVNVKPEPIWIQDHQFCTSAGVTAGIDLCPALLEEDHGAALALEVARVLVVFLRRPGNQAQFSVSLATQAGERKPLHELRVWMAEHLTADLSVPALARRVAMSPRNFQRVFTSETGNPPAVTWRNCVSRRRGARTTQSIGEKSPTAAALPAPTSSGMPSLASFWPPPASIGAASLLGDREKR